MVNNPKSPIPHQGEAGDIEVTPQETRVYFKDKDGNPIETLSIRIEAGDEGKFCQLMLSMVAATAEANRKYGVGIDRHVCLSLEALAETVKIAFTVDPLDEPVDIIGDIVAFHEKFDLAYNGKPRNLSTHKDDVGAILSEFRTKFMREEIDEYEDEQVALDVATADRNEEEIAKRLEKQLDALVDELYVAAGTGYLQFGARVMKEAWRRVHAANMKKVRCTDASQSKRGSLFDVVKPKDWVEPDHSDLVADHAHVTYRHPGKLNPGHERDTQVVPPKDIDFVGTNQ